MLLGAFARSRLVVRRPGLRTVACRRLTGPSSRAAAARLLPATGAIFAGGILWSTRRSVLAEEPELELPPVPEPDGHFVHPYTSWPWYRRFWFTVKRSLFLAWVFWPFFLASGLLLLDQKNQRRREIWLDQVLICMQRAGCAFQKFGQWLSMRPDMFPPDVIEVLSRLRSDAPSHPAKVTREIVREALGKDVDELFEHFQDECIASGSVGQVHRARLRESTALDGPGGQLRDVAVKVRHPGVVDSAFMDLDILWKVVDWTQRFIHMTMPFDRGEFDEVIQAQMDFTREAFNLQKFARNFRGETAIRFPKVAPCYAMPSVLVETWAEGKVISHILDDFDNFQQPKAEDDTSVKAKRALQLRLSRILYDMSMKMMVRDNFVHGDLHGGNILYSEADDHVTVLDAGIASRLEPASFAPFGKFLHALCSGHTENLVKYLQHFNESKVTVDLTGFTQDIQMTMDKFMSPLRPNADLPVNAADMFGEVMFTMQRYGMRLKGDVASILFTISISEGLVRQLDPAFDVATNAVPYILKHMPFAFLRG